ncbi:hypothetical protein EDD29_3523 [Actinocorallia herbida]|uniref:Beta/gamma crystallin n=1 Tax=Actinocorallia herbida TaxID=58109 RepID=A0A3N1CYU6_9ACTN|nr:hypothetical protein [Actinocorallia herbida]ROO85968.1 hypothetical protein EDD29_3523 [Actinocorallia herbida]
MRQLLRTSLCALPVAAALLAATPAQAAVGKLHVGQMTYFNPGGCYPAYLWPLTVRNETNELVRVHDDGDCDGKVLAVVKPGGSTVQKYGGSVSID